MSISKDRKREVVDCAESSIDRLRKKTELAFNKEGHHKSGRSGNHGKKFNKLSTVIIQSKNDAKFLLSTGCFENDDEKKIVEDVFVKHSKQFQKKAKSINHK